MVGTRYDPTNTDKKGKSVMSDLQRLLDAEAIAQTLTRGARLLDQRDWDAIPRVFADNVVFEYADGVERRGLAAMRDLSIGYLGNCGPTQHLLGNLMTDIDGDTATSQIYCRARHQGLGERAHLFYDAHGEYRDRWERRPEGWRIVERIVTISLAKGDPAALGVSGDITLNIGT